MISAVISTLRLFIKSTWFSTKLRIPTAEIMPYSTIDTPPTTQAGITSISAINFGQNENNTANSAAMRTTRGSNTFVKASTPVFSPYVVFAGAPNSDAAIVARPSPSSVRCRPGLAIKFLFTVELMAEMSPICSTIVAKASGTIAMMALMARPPFIPPPKSANTVLFHSSGKPIHGASITC